MKLYKSSDKSNFECSGFAIAAIFAVCPGGEGAVLKTVGCKRLAGSNPVYGVYLWITCNYQNCKYGL